MYYLRHRAIRFATVFIVAFFSCNVTSTAHNNNDAKSGETAIHTDVEKERPLAGPRIVKDDMQRPGRSFSGKRHKKQHRGIFKTVIEELNLTDKQKAEVRAAMAQHRKVHKDSRKAGSADKSSMFKKPGVDMKQLRTAMEAARKAKDFDQMRQLRAQRQQAMAKGRANRDAMKKQLATILTAEQLKQFETKMKAHREKMRQAHQKHRRGQHSDIMNSDQRRRNQQQSQHRTRSTPEPPDNGAEDNKLDI